MNRQLPKPSNNNQYIRRKSRRVQAGQPGNTQQPPNNNEVPGQNTEQPITNQENEEEKSQTAENTQQPPNNNNVHSPGHNTKQPTTQQQKKEKKGQTAGNTQNPPKNNEVPGRNTEQPITNQKNEEEKSQTARNTQGFSIRNNRKLSPDGCNPFLNQDMYSPERNFFGAGTESSSEKKVQTSILNISQAPFSPQTHNNNVPQNQYPDRQYLDGKFGQIAEGINQMNRNLENLVSIITNLAGSNPFRPNIR